jgi:hypothetical protein
MRRFLPRLEFYCTPRCWLFGLYKSKWGPFQLLLGPVRLEVH